MVNLRDERAKMLGFDYHVAYVPAYSTAGTAEVVNDMLG